MAQRFENSRRAFLRKAASAAAAGGAMAAIGAAPASAKTGSATPTIIVPRLQELRRNAKSAQQFSAATREVAKTMVKDRTFAAKLLENVDSVNLINLFNQNRATLEPVVGKIDGRTAEGRYTKILVAAELFQGVSSVDGVKLVHGSEELTAQPSGSSSSSSSTCSGCDAGGSATLGCCIVHFWGWTCTGSCTPCNG